MSSVRIEMRDHGSGGVFVDGVPLQDVIAVRFRAAHWQANRVLIVLEPREVIVDAHVAEVTRETREPQT